jgi:hypothetical protein
MKPILPCVIAVALFLNSFASVAGAVEKRLGREPTLPTVTGQWQLMPQAGGLAAVFAGLMPNGEVLQLGVTCRTDEPSTARLIVAYFDDWLTDNAQGVEAGLAGGLSGATLETLPGQKTILALFGINPHFDQIRKHKSIIFIFEIDRDWLRELWRGGSIRLRLNGSRQYAEALPGFEFPVGESSEMVRTALKNCAPSGSGDHVDYNKREMTFEVHGTDSNCDDCGWIFARGLITLQTAIAFEKFMSGGVFLAGRAGRLNIRLQSEGGSLSGGLALGRMFRKYRMSTFVGGKQAQLTWGGQLPEPREQECVSACAYAFLGGIDRKVFDNGRYGMHQFYQEDAAQQPTAPLLSGKDYSEAQRLQSLLVEYVREMEVDPGLVTLASSAPPWGPMRYLSADERSTYRVDSAGAAAGEWSLHPAGDGRLLAAIDHTQHGEVFQLIVSCGQVGSEGTLILVEHNYFPRDNIINIDKASRGGSITFGNSGDDLRFYGSTKNRINAIVGPTGNELTYVLNINWNQLLHEWKGTKITIKMPTVDLVLSEVAGGVSFPIGNSQEMIRLVFQNYSAK